VLEGDRSENRLAKRADALEGEVELPTWWTDFFQRQGPMPTCAGDRRRFPRSYFRSNAALHYRQTFPALPRAEAQHGVYTKDVSRAGLSFYHVEQLFPREQMSIVLPDGRTLHFEVVRCRRIQERCYEIGATFVSVPAGQGGD
jgi:hypothetical protein